MDRDGVLIADVDLLTRWDQVRVYPDVLCQTRRLQDAGFLLVVITNQPAVARGLMSEQDVEDLHKRLTMFIAEKCGGEIGKFYFCPHHPKADVTEYRVLCQCRKPRPGMLHQAAEELGVELSKSYMIGDRPSDIVAGRKAGCTTILIESGMHKSPPIEMPNEELSEVEPDYVCSSLTEATNFILGAIH